MVGWSYIFKCLDLIRITTSVHVTSYIKINIKSYKKIAVTNLVVFACALQMSWRPTYRSSKFRNVYGKVANREHCFEGIPITKNVHDNHFCAVNAKFLAIVTESAGGGSFVVIPVTQVTTVTQLARALVFSLDRVALN